MGWVEVAMVTQGHWK